MYTNLTGRFGEAGLELRLADAPFQMGRGAAEIFQMDIRRAKSHDAKSEFFLAWPGSDPSSAMVLAADRRLRQVVLSVREPERVFEEFIPSHMVRAAASKEVLAARLGVRPALIVVRDGANYLRRVTPASARHVLAGRDERQLFMCQLPERVTSVKQAHDALRAPEATGKSRSALTRPVRQGEWFFLVATDEELRSLEAAVRKSRAVIRKKAAINSFIPRAGKPHVADEIVRVTFPGSFGDVRVFVRGAIRHPDHHTLRITQWRRVVRNREMDVGRSPLGGTWID
jgi:hypothetical protein